MEENKGRFEKGRVPWNKGRKGRQKNHNVEGLKKGNGWNKGISVISKICECCGSEFSGNTGYIKYRKFCGSQCASKINAKKISDTLTGRKLGENHKESIRLSRKVLWEDNEELREKISKTNKERMKRIVHHINGNHSDNRLENRMHMSQSDHIKLHIKQGDVKPWEGRWLELS